MNWRNVRYGMCMFLTLMILMSMLFTYVTTTVTKSIVITKAEQETGVFIDEWIKDFYYWLEFIWHWTIAIVIIFVVWRFLWYPEQIFTGEIKSWFIPKKKSKKVKAK